ncbi:SLC13 family permease [Anaerotignum sp.]|uniref:SLC13 family permease n=1 Tax=Anaerotignum sp. TaxID=2039241 RepID=UPI0027149DB9|nr:SLC13 family permease [Anaerotignum sp.]
MKELRKFIYGDPVLFVAFVVAIISALFVHPSKKYLEYLDLRVLSLLFSMMMVVAGFQKAGIFECIITRLLKIVHNTRVLVFILVGICFFSSMLITNDVALITFVPLSIMMLTQTEKRKLMIPVIVLQTIAANLGSMLTPLGNPQNLYLYSISNMTMGQFLKTMAMPSAISLLLLFAVIFFVKPEAIELSGEGFQGGKSEVEKPVLWCLLFFICLLAVLRMIPYGIALIFVLSGVLIFAGDIFLRVDYGLLLTFILLFIFIGNIRNIPAVSNILYELVGGRELMVSILLSQIISNVPATMLLSKFTANYSGLLVGVNLGGLGTLIASMASVISYKAYASTRGAQTCKYLCVFTAINLLFLGVLWLVVAVV